MARRAGLGPTEILGEPGQNPFAALTSIEAIARLGDRSADLPRALSLTERPTAWLVLARIGERPWFFTVGEPVEFAPTLCELAWNDTETSECDVPQEVLQVLSDHEAFLRAAVAAPASLQLDAPEAVAWRVLLASARTLELSTEDLVDLRERLLRRHRQGVRRRLARLVAEHSMPRLLRYVRGIPSPLTAPRITLVTCLGVAPEHTGRLGV